MFLLGPIAALTTWEFRKTLSFSFISSKKVAFMMFPREEYEIKATALGPEETEEQSDH